MKYIKSRHNLVHEKKSKTVDIEITIEDDRVELITIIGDNIGEGAPSTRSCNDIYQAKTRARTLVQKYKAKGFDLINDEQNINEEADEVNEEDIPTPKKPILKIVT
ncbi:hypothetical protein MNBD_GAMMA23-192 [hydrothermal vent metagenome]|uniref:Uncharacterized protein n=1 Tax=hydrothermal vent metagenome TaxID=652676 RepID=A0A3B1A1A5_9ZZZZ